MWEVPVEHTNPHRERLLGRMVFAGVSWVIFHVWAAIYNGVHSIDHGDGHSYGWQGYALTAAYLLSLLVFDGLAYFARSRTAGRVLAKFWAVCGAVTAIILAICLTGAADKGLVILFLLLLPFVHLLPVLELVMVNDILILAVIFALCAGHLVWFLWLYRLAGGCRDLRADESSQLEETT